MESDGKNDEPLTSPVSTMDDRAGESSFNNTVDDGPGSTVDDGASDWKHWVSVSSTIDGSISEPDGKCNSVESALELPDETTDVDDGRRREADGTFCWDPQETCVPSLESTVWPLGSSLLATTVARPELVAGFEILSELGHGGMGIVYKARHLRLKRLVALKVIRYDRHSNREDLARFQIEAEVVARLNHPNIVRIYEIGTARDVPYVALELLEGGTLKDRLAGNPQPLRETAKLLSTLARAVHAAHAAGVLHRDIKPSNVLFDHEGTPKIADFGLAKRLDVEDGETITGQVIGTPSYMAPEQAQGWAREIGHAVDIYSLGAILYEMLTGRPPIKGETQAETLRLVIEEDPVTPSHLRPKVSFDLETICLKCIARDPQKRYASALALADDLDRFLEGEPVLARRTPVWERAIKLSQRHPVKTVMLAMGLIASGIIFAAVQHAQKRESDRIRHAQQREADRIGTLVQTAEEEVFKAQGAVAQENWADARRIVSGLLSLIETEQESRLVKLRERALSLDEQARRCLAEQTAVKEAQDRLAKFRQLRDVALYLDTRFDGLEPGNSIDATCRSARAGLGVFGVGGAGDRWALATLPSELTEEEKGDVANGFYELLLILADAVSQSPAAESCQQAEQALRIIDRAPAVRSGSTRAYHLRRSAYLDMKGDRRGAARERDLAERLAPQNAFDLFLIGRELFRKSEWKAAITYFEAATQKQKNHFWSQCLLAICYFQLKEPAPARFLLAACLREKPDCVWLYLLHGLASAAEGERIRDATQVSPEQTGSLPAAALKRFEIADADYRQAFKLLGRSAADADLRYALLVNRGIIQLERQEFAGAALDFAEAIRLNDRRVEAVCWLADVYRRQGRIDDALEQLAKAIERQPNRADLHRTRADLLLGLERSDLRDVVWHALEARIGQLSPERRDAALGALETAIRCESPEKSVLIALDTTKQAAIFRVAHRNLEALKACKRALDLAPQLALAHQLRIHELLDLKRYDELLHACDLALHAIKPSAELYVLRGMAKDGLADYRGATDDYTLALALQPESPRVLCRRGWSYLAYDSDRHALRDFEDAVSLDSNDADAFSGRGLARARLGLYLEAVTDAERSLQLREKDWRMHYNAACIYFQSTLAVDAKSRKTGPPAIRDEKSYIDRAVKLLRIALQLAPEEQRAVLLRKSIPKDRALRPFRQHLKWLEGLKVGQRSRPQFSRSAPA